MRNTALKTLALGCLLGASAAASAFTPVGGLWGFTNELNGQPGRGFQLTVENDVLVFYYYGYDSDGSGNYMFASGPLVNGSVFTGQLLTCRGGTVMGSAYKAATCSNGPGKVTMTFASGEKGTITLPGEVPKAINRFNFGYADGPDALLGEFMFAYKATTFNHVDFYRLTIKTGLPTTVGGRRGTGFVANADYTFGCEFYPSINGFQSIYVCAEESGDNDDDNYYFRMVGDRGAGTASWRGNTSGVVYPTQILRVATAKGTRTAPYNENHASMVTPKHVDAGLADVLSDPLGQVKASDPASALLDAEANEHERQFTDAWAEQARAVLADLKSRGK